MREFIKAFGLYFGIPFIVMCGLYVWGMNEFFGDRDYAPGFDRGTGYVVYDYTGDRVVNGKLSESKRVTKLRSFLDKMDGVTGRGKYGSVGGTERVYGIAFTEAKGKLTSRYAVHNEKGVWRVYRIGKRLGKMELKTSESDRKKLDEMVMGVLRD